MENPLERLTWVRDRVSLNSKSFAESIGMTAAALHNMYTRKSRVTPVLANSVELVHGVRAEWLLTGEGDQEVAEYSGLTPLERCGLNALLSHSQKWYHLEHLIFEKHESKISDYFGKSLREGVDLENAQVRRKNALFQLNSIRQVFRELERDEQAILNDKELRGKEKLSEKEKKTRLGQALLLAVHFGDEWESIKADCQQWKDVVEDETAKEFNKLHSHINKIRGGIDI